MASMDEVGKLLPPLPALQPPRLLDLAISVLMGLEQLPPSLDDTPDILDWLCYGLHTILGFAASIGRRLQDEYVAYSR
jgi:hypothetical protein